MTLNLVSLTLFLLLSLALRGSSFQRKRRYRQWWGVLLALVFTGIILYYWNGVSNWRPWEGVTRHPLLQSLWADLTGWLGAQTWYTELETRGIPDLLTRLAQEVNRSLNLAVLALYLVVKNLFRLLTRPILLLTPDNASRIPARFFYETTHRGALLRREWWFSRRFFTLLTYSTFTLTLLTVGFGLPGGWVALSFIVLYECAAFFRGEMQTEVSARRVELPRVAETSQGEVDLEALARSYRKRWGAWLLSEGTYSRPLSRQPEGDSVGVCGSLGDGLRPCCTMLSELMEGGSVLLEDVLPYRITPCLGFFLRDRLIRGQRLLVLVDEEEDIPSGRVWLREMLGESDWRVLDAQGALDTPPHALVATLRQDLFRLLNETWARELTVLVVLDAQATAVWHGAEMEALVQALIDTTGRSPQLVALADWRLNIEGAVRNIIGLEVREIQLGSAIERAHYLAWRLESPDRHEAFQNRLFGNLNAYVSPETSLAYPAVGAGIKGVLLTAQDTLPWAEFMNEGDNASRSGILKDYGGTLLEPNLTVVPTVWQLADQRDPCVVIARDEAYNLPAALRKWMSLGNTRNLVQVVSPPYLLRDYFAAHLETLLSERRAFSALAPTALSLAWARAYSLYRRLERGWVDADAIERTLSELRLDENLETALTRLFEEQLELYGVSFSYRSLSRFNASLHPFGGFEEALQLHLGTAARNFRPTWHEVIEVIAHERGAEGQKVLARFYRGHLHQHLLEEQVHAFNGQLYRIRRIKETYVQAEWVPTRHYRDGYRQMRRYTLAWDARSRVRRREPAPDTRTTQLSLALYETPIEVLTTAYLAFSPHLALDLLRADEVTLETPIHRHYRHGRVLELRLIPPDGVTLESETVSFTLALLLNEMLPSYYPEVHHYVTVSTALAPAPAEDAFSRRLRSLVPELTGVPQEGIRLLFIKDSPFDMGILPSLWDNLPNMFEDLRAYLDWALADPQHSRYLCFGRDTLPPQLDLTGVLSLLTHLHPVGVPARANLPQTGRFRVEGERACDFCGSILEASHLRTLPDGRDRCNVCAKDAVDTLAELRRLFKEARDFLKTRYNIIVRSHIEIEFTTADVLARASGSIFTPTPERDERFVGLAVRSSRGMRILIENAQSRYNTQATLVHELVHIWQYDTLPADAMKDTELIEGHALWVSIDYLRHLGYPQLDAYERGWLARGDVYGKGLETMKRLMQASGADSPFKVLWERYRVKG